MKAIWGLSKATKLGLLLLTTTGFTTLLMINTTTESTAYFTADTSTAGDQLQTGKLQIALQDGESITNPFVVNNLVPGDFIERVITVKNTGTVPFNFKLSTVKGTNTSALWTDATNGLQISINNGAAVGISTYTQANTITIQPNQSQAVTVKIILPATADNSFQNLNQDFNLKFTASSQEGVKRNE